MGEERCVTHAFELENHFFQNERFVLDRRFEQDVALLAPAQQIVLFDPLNELALDIVFRTRVDLSGKPISSNCA